MPWWFFLLGSWSTWWTSARGVADGAIWLHSVLYAHELEFGTNMHTWGISLAMPMYCKWQSRICYVWNEDRRVEGAGCPIAFSPSLPYTARKHRKRRSKALKWSLAPHLRRLCRTVRCLQACSPSYLKQQWHPRDFWMSGRYTRGREHEAVANPLISPRKADVKRKSDQQSVRRGGS